MIKKLLAISLAACSLSASAQAIQSWNFVLSGPFAHGMDRVIVDETYTGSFSAIDRDGDGLFALDEVVALAIDYNSFAPCYRDECVIESFSYSGGNELSFVARSYSQYDDPMFPSSSRLRWTVGPTGGGWESVYCNQMCNDWNWASAEPGVTLTVTAAVPEPQTYAMLGAGLAGIGYLARRRRSASRAG